MSDDVDTDSTVTKPETFTREQLRKMIGAEVKKVREQYADYEDLKAKAADADKSKTKLDKMSEQLEALTKRAETAEIDSARGRVAEKLGLTSKEAKRLSGKTYDELLADGEELVEDLGIDTAARKRGETSRKPKGTTDDAGSDDGDDGSDEHDDDASGDDDGQQQTQREERRPAPRRRPRELRSGAPATTGSAEPRDPLDLIKDVPRGR